MNEANNYKSFPNNKINILITRISEKKKFFLFHSSIKLIQYCQCCVKLLYIIIQLFY